MKKGYVSISQESEQQQKQESAASIPVPSHHHPHPQYMSDLHHEKMGDDSVPTVAYARTTTVNRFMEWCRQTYHGDRRHNANAPLLPSEKRHVTFQQQSQPPAIRPRSKLTKFLAGAALLVSSVVFFNHFMPASDTLFQDFSTIPLEDASRTIKSVPSSDFIREFFHYYAAEPHLAGSHADKRQAEWTRDKFELFGIPNATIETYYPWINTPKTRRLAIVSGPEEFLYEAKLEEDTVAKDPSTNHPNAIPTFHGYSADGNVTGSVVYVNYGRLNDFQFLAARGVNFTGTIALMRHGLIARGLKVRAAEKFGCTGALLYSDPMEDGPFNKENDEGEPSESYPNGPWRSPSSVERGTVQYMSILPGDMLTPGYASTENATRLDPEEAYAMPKIPSLPISWSDALPLFQAMEGLGLKGEIDWLGGLCEVNYYSGPSVAQVNLVNINDYQIKPVWNVIGKIEGAIEPHRAVILGTHRDAWGFGGAESSSGSAILLELSRVLGLLLERGWQPRRTLILASWDGQGYGSIGSTEWVEDNKSWLDDEGVVYINVDQAVTGPHFAAQATPLLNKLIFEVTQEVWDPRTSMPVYDAWRQDRATMAVDDIDVQKKHKKKHREDEPITAPIVKMIDPLGGGSDYMAFFNHLGIASMSMSFNGDYGVYHSNYDSIYWMEHFGDPTYEYHQTMVRIWGLLALRLSSNALLPMSPLEYSRELSIRVAAMADDQGCATLPELSAAVSALHETSFSFEHKLHKLQKKLHKHEMDVFKHKKKHKKLMKKLVKYNERLAQFERGFIDPVGLPGREWFKHIVYAPGLWTGYQAEMFPSIVEAIDQGASPSFTREMEERAAGFIESARGLLKGKHARFVDDDDKSDDNMDDDDDHEDEDIENPEEE
ncbi:hypothetical protein BDA99DRAFT_524322 [Phascolomyces articulosus]|uniref:Glutamate carboxypeptidase n=1 Tax=Phascolomyces articulosus TaxID=60185 RepID=A0AAD5P909_9FUNG|nr:hypothetical protein BDA99DRAFT_524322 [Phascolomyces articulosus]